MQSIRILPNGELVMIYDDSFTPGLIDEGEGQTKRASHVEPDASGQGWTADMAPSGGPVLGPYRLRQEALDAEVAWINVNVLQA